MDFLHRHIEALIFCAPEPLGVNEMVSCLSEMFGAVVPAKDVELALADLCTKYGEPEFSFALEKLGGGYQFLTKPAYQPSISILLRQNSHKRLSTAQLETLSIIAYKQPLSRQQVASIRGVDPDAVMRTLQARGYITEVSRDDGPGQAILFGTTAMFLERLGLDSLASLPPIADFVPPAEVVEALEQGLRIVPSNPMGASRNEVEG